MTNNGLAPHEAIEVREYMGQEMLGIKKLSASMVMVQDNELKQFMEDSVAAKKTAMKEIQAAIQHQLGQSQNQSQS